MCHWNIVKLSWYRKDICGKKSFPSTVGQKEQKCLLHSTTKTTEDIKLSSLLYNLVWYQIIEETILQCEITEKFIKKTNTYGVNHQKNKTERKDDVSLGQGLAGEPSVWVCSLIGVYRYNGETSANSEQMKDTAINTKRNINSTEMKNGSGRPCKQNELHVYNMSAFLL